MYCIHSQDKLQTIRTSTALTVALLITSIYKTPVLTTALRSSSTHKTIYKTTNLLTRLFTNHWNYYYPYCCITYHRHFFSSSCYPTYQIHSQHIITSHWHYCWPYYDISYPIYSHDYFQTTVTTIILIVVLHTTDTSTILPAKSDSDVRFCLQSYQGLIIDRSLVY